jgi:hypothetical protein
MFSFCLDDGVESQDYGSSSQPTTTFPLRDYLLRYQERTTNAARRALSSNNDTPCNLLSLLGKICARVLEPKSIRILNYGFLETLTTNI